MIGSSFFAEALAEYEDAVVYYETREQGLGARLVQELDHAVALAMEFPESGRLIHDAPTRFGLRWVLLQTFPLKLVYTVRDDALVVVAVFHAHRRPGYWLERLKRLEV